MREFESAETASPADVESPPPGRDGAHPAEGQLRRAKTNRQLLRRVTGSVVNHPANAHAPWRALTRAAGWQLRKRVGKGPVRISAYGMDLELPRWSGGLSNYFYFTELFDWDLIQFSRRFLRPGDVVVDAGANVGMFTYAAAQAVGRSGRVHAFEPIPNAAEVIRGNVSRNGLSDYVDVHELAVVDRDQTVRFTCDLDVANHVAWESGDAAGRGEEVEVKGAAISDVVGRDTLLTLVKLDVEGSEFLALTGLSDHLTGGQPPVISLEINEDFLGRNGSSSAQVRGHLADLGYELFEFDGQQLSPAEPQWFMEVLAINASTMEMVHERLRTAAR